MQLWMLDNECLASMVLNKTRNSHKRCSALLLLLIDLNSDAYKQNNGD